jgi:hypothetical protein
MEVSGVRQVQASKARARALLHRLGRFLENFLQTGGAAGEKRRLKLKHVKKWAPSYRSAYKAGELPQDFEAFKRFVSVTFNILEAIAKEQTPTDVDLRALTDVLYGNHSYHDFIQFRPDGDNPSGWVKEPYRLPDKLDILFAKDLLDYMNLAARYGREHGICELEGCGTLMMTGRGGKKFCSPECRKAYWSYDRQKTYYLEKQATSRGSAGALKKQRQKKGKLQHGRHRPKKG